MMNKIILLGRLTSAPEIKTTSNEKLVGKFTLAVPRKYIKDDEERKVDFINIVAFGKTAEFVSKFFQKGQQVLVTGRLEINQYDDENGERKYSTQVIAEELDFADSKKEKDDNESDYLNFLYENENFIEEKNKEESKSDENSNLF